MNGNGVVLNLRTTFPEVMREIKQFGDQLQDRVLVRSANASAQQGRTEMARRIASEFRIKVGDVKDRLKVTPAKAGGAVSVVSASLEARNKAKGRSMNLIHFVEQVVTIAASRKRMKAGEGRVQTLRGGGKVRKALQVRFQIKRTGGQKMVKGAFIANKGRTVFVRIGASRFPIKALNTIDVPSMFNTRRINEVVVEIMKQRFAANAQREIDSALRGFLK